MISAIGSLSSSAIGRNEGQSSKPNGRGSLVSCGILGRRQTFLTAKAGYYMSRWPTALVVCQNLIWHLCGILVQRTTNYNAVLMRDFERYQAEGTYQPKMSPNTTHFSSQTGRWSDRNEELRGVGVCSCDFHLEYSIDASYLRDCFWERKSKRFLN